MKKIFTISALILILLGTVTGIAQPVGIVDGHNWIEWETKAKEAYIFGMADATNIFAIAMRASFDGDATREEAIQRLKEEEKLKSGEDLEASEIIEKVDMFYDRHNLDITFIEALFEMEELEEELVE